MHKRSSRRGTSKETGGKERRESQLKRSPQRTDVWSGSSSRGRLPGFGTETSKSRVMTRG